MSTEYTHFSRLSFDTLFARGIDGSELPIITAAGVIQNVTISGATISGALSVTSLVASGTVTGSNLSGTNTGNVTLVAVGATPNANGASLSGQALTLQPADGTNPGLLTSGVQTIGGAKTFSGAITASNLSGTNTGDQTITLTGNVTGTGTGSFATTIASNVITNAMVNSAAAIAYSKLSLTGSIVNADIVASAGIPYSKLTLTTSIVNGDIATAAGIAVTKLANGTANQLIGANAGATANEFKSLATGTSGTDFAIAHTANTITFNIPDASGSNRGLVTTGTQTFGGTKTFADAVITTSLTVGSTQASYQNSFKGAWASKVGLIVWNTDTGTTAGGIVAATSATSGTQDLLAAYNNAASTRVFSVQNIGNVILGPNSMATTATDGFVYMPSCAGAPTGVPTAITGHTASIYDTSNNKLYIYNGGWKSVTLA